MRTQPQKTSGQERWVGSQSSNYLLLSLLICCIVVLLVVGYQSANRANLVHAPLVDAAMEIKLEATIGYLQLKELISGEIHIPIDQVWAHYDQADWYAKAMLKGGVNEEGAIRPLEDSELRKTITDVRAILARFAAVSRVWYQEMLSSPSEDESEVDQIYHELFSDLINSADQVEVALKKSIATELRSFRSVQFATLIAISFLAIGTCYVFIRSERIRNSYLLELEAARNDLEVRVEERTAALEVLNQQLTLEVKDRRAAEVALYQSEMALRQLLAAVMEAQEQERARVAGELTEGIGQTMAAVNLVVGAAMKKVGTKSNSGIIDDLETILRFIETALIDLRGLRDDLHPEILDLIGIQKTINWFCRNFQEVNQGIRVNHESNLNENEIPQHLKIQIFRILQEALANITKNSNADLVEVRFDRTEDGIQLAVKDNGCKIEHDKEVSVHQAHQIGIHSIQERANQSGGLFTIESLLNTGTLVCVTWGLTDTELVMGKSAEGA